MLKPRFLAIALLITLAGCQSQTTQTAVLPNQATTTVSATLTTTAAGQTVSVTQVDQLPERVRQAAKLQVAAGGALIDVTRSADGSITFTTPANTPLVRDAAGNVNVLFVVNEHESVAVTLATGAPVAFAQPPVLTDPPSGAIVLGSSVRLTANTTADPAQYQFAWSFASSSQGPFQPIPGDAKTVSWTPATAGNFYIRVEAINRATRQTSVVTNVQPVAVNTADTVIVTEPASGFVSLGDRVSLSFRRPAGFVGTRLNYAWSVSPSLQGPWTALTEQGERVSFTPGAPGSYFVRLEVSNEETGEVATFVSPTAAVVVGQSGPIITPSRQSVERGDAVELKLGAESADNAGITWYMAPSSGGVTGAFTRIQGVNGKTIQFVATDAGAFNFRADVPQPDGTIATFTTSAPVLSVVETTPIIQSVPPNAVIKPGEDATLVLNARGVPEGEFRFIFSVGLSAQGPWQTIVLADSDELTEKRRKWQTTRAQFVTLPNGNTTQVPGTTPGAYYVKVDASEVNGTRAFTFISNTPVVTVQP
jgi:hypothetical protein